MKDIHDFFSSCKFRSILRWNIYLIRCRLEVFCSVIYHHASENPNITYGILQSRKTFEDLGTFTLTRGLREVKRAQQAKEASQQANPNSKGKVSVDEVEMADAGAEKARLLENEGASHGNDSTDREREDSGHASLGEDVLTRPLMSPNAELPYSTVDSPISEKARGKMRERRSLSVDTINSLDHTSLGIGKSGFVPTQEWVFIFSFLPSEVFAYALFRWRLGSKGALDPASQKILTNDFSQTAFRYCNDLYFGCNSEGGGYAETENRSLVGRDPISIQYWPEPCTAIESTYHSAKIYGMLTILTFRLCVLNVIQWSDASLVWLTSLIWGEIYVRGMTPLGIWNATNVRLFFVKHAQNQPLQITETVSNVVGGFLRRTSDATHSRQRVV